MLFNFELLEGEENIKGDIFHMESEILSLTSYRFISIINTTTSFNFERFAIILNGGIISVSFYLFFSYCLSNRDREDIYTTTTNNYYLYHYRSITFECYNYKDGDKGRVYVDIRDNGTVIIRNSKGNSITYKSCKVSLSNDTNRRNREDLYIILDNMNYMANMSNIVIGIEDN